MATSRTITRPTITVLEGLRLWGLALPGELAIQREKSTCPLNYKRLFLRLPDFLCRFSQMMWRLNFLVFFTCLVLRNSYMLYYICPMHTIFTVLVYASLGILPQYNQSNAFLLVK